MAAHNVCCFFKAAYRSCYCQASVRKTAGGSHVVIYVVESCQLLQNLASGLYARKIEGT